MIDVDNLQNINKTEAIDVSLISPPGRASSVYPPLGLMCIAAYLKKNKIKTNIIDIKSKQYGDFDKRDILNKTIEKIKKDKPEIIGITCTSTEVKDVLDLSESIKQEHNVVIVVGGIHPTVCPSDFLYEDCPIDYVVIGEGEQTMLELTQKIKNKQDTADIKGIAYFKGKPIITKPRPNINNLDDLPFPAYELIDMEYYTKPHTNLIRPFFLSGFYLYSGRGCPYNCMFCANKNISNMKLRVKSYNYFVDEIEYLIDKYSIDGIYIFDDIFAVKRERVINFCNELKKRKLKLIWGCQMRVDNITEEMIKAMKNVGCVQIDFGVESGSQRMLDNVNKGITINQIREAFKLCQKYRIRTFANIMFNMIDETEEDVHETLDLCKEIKADVYSFAIMTPFPGTDIYTKIKPLSIEEYQLCGPAPFKFNPMFKFSKHDIDLDRLIYSLYKNNRTYKNVISCFLNLKYIKKIVGSKRKKGYLTEGICFSKFWIPRILRY